METNGLRVVSGLGFRVVGFCKDLYAVETGGQPCIVQ